MDSATSLAAPVSYPVFAAVALGITGRSVYEVIDLVGGMFESAGAVFEGSPDAPGTLLALLPPSDRAGIDAVRLALQAQTAAPALRLGIDATEVRAKKEQDAKWQHVIDSALRLQKAARSGEAIAGDEIEQLSHGAIATQALQVGEEGFLLLTGVRDVAATPDVIEVASAAAIDGAQAAPAAPVVVPPGSTTAEPAPVARPDPREATDAVPVVLEPAPVPTPIPSPEPRPVPVPVDRAPEPPTHPQATPTDTPAGSVPKVAAAMHPSARWDGRLVGRDAPLADLRSRLDRVLRDRTAACVLVTGEPGIGRTRLVTDFTASVDEETRVFRVSCAPPDAGGDRWPLAPIVEALTGLHPLDPEAVVRARLGVLVTGQPDGDRLAAHLLATLALDGRLQTDEMRWALRRLLELALGDAPAVLHLDDVDRPGAGFVRMLADVVGAMRGTALLIVATARREADHVPAIRLGPLTSEATAAVIEDLLGATEPGLADAVAARVHGDPFILEQTLAVLTESGTLAPGQGRWLPLADLATVPLPDGPVGLIRRRLQTVPPHELAVLGMAAVTGERFVAESIREVIPEEARAHMPILLAGLVARGFLVAAGDGEYRFRHALIREATIGGAPDWAQAATHVRVARDLERAAGERLWRVADVVGDHLAAACALRADAPASDRDDALELLTWAAAAAIDQGDLDGAARLERRAAALVEADPARRAELLYLAAEHGATAAPERPADREIAEAALVASVAGDDVDWRVRLLRARLRTTAGHDDALEGARTTADEAIAAFDEDEATWALSSAWALRGLVHAVRAQNGLVADEMLRAADHAGAVGRWREETACLRGAATALLQGPATVDEAEARCRSYLGRVRGALADHDLRSAIALLQARRSAFDEARATIEPSARALDELGAAADLAIVLRRAGEIEILAGQPEAAEPQMQRAMIAAAEARDEALRASIAASFAHILAADEDRLDEALALADVAEAHAEDLATQVGWRLARARVMARRGRGAQAERLVREGLSLAERTDSTDLRANALVAAADVRRHAGRPTEAEPFERRALRLFERRGATAQAASVLAILRPREPSQLAVDPVDAVPSREPDPTPTSEDDGRDVSLAAELVTMEAADDVEATPDVDGAGRSPGPVPTPPLGSETEPESQRRWLSR